MLQYIGRFEESTQVLITLSIALFAGFVMTRMTNTLNLAKVSGYILSGILVTLAVKVFFPVSWEFALILGALPPLRWLPAGVQEV